MIPIDGMLAIWLALWGSLLILIIGPTWVKGGVNDG